MPACRRILRQAPVLCAFAACAALGLIGLPGCEERVISARGLGADQYKVEEPLYDPPEWERVIMGDPARRGKNNIITRDNPQ